MVAHRIHIVFLVETRTRRHVDLAPDYRLYPGGFRFFIEVHSAVHDTVVSDRKSCLSELHGTLHKIFDPAGTVEQAVFTVNMQMNKCHYVLLPAYRAAPMYLKSYVFIIPFRSALFN